MKKWERNKMRTVKRWRRKINRKLKRLKGRKREYIMNWKEQEERKKPVK
jgi:hypothetical protein